MDTLCSSSGIIDMEHPGQGVLDIAGAGFQGILADFSKLCIPAAIESFGRGEIRHKRSSKILEHPEKLQQAVCILRDKCRQSEIAVDVAAAPYFGKIIERADLRELLVRLSEESICACGSLGCKHLIVRPLYDGTADADIWERNREFYLRLAPLAREHGVVLLLENLCKDINGHLVRGICSDSVMAAEWVDRLNEEVQEERFGFCMDVGACNLCGQNMYDFIEDLGSRIKAVILSDNDGDKEDALLPFSAAHHGQSSVDWLNLIRGLRAVSYDGRLVIDLGDTAGAFSPLLRPSLMKLAKSAADYLQWQIGIERLLEKYSSRVLFGGGNMCRNYMKCYGEKYPPLYTCDNNSERWGTTFCGLTVKPPASLHELPEDTAIFICNIYYREIEQQLRDMGIRNPIEFFNDEYLPSYHFQRVEDIVGRV